MDKSFCFSLNVIIVDKFFGYLLSLKDRSEDQQHRIHVEPRLTTQLTAVSACRMCVARTSEIDSI